MVFRIRSTVWLSLMLSRVMRIIRNAILGFTVSFAARTLCAELPGCEEHD